MLYKAKNPIGIFDSGVGGLTVANAIAIQLPNESLVYFGDTAHLPYGEKSPQNIKKYSHEIINYLLQQNCKAIVIACNSASSHAYNYLKEQLPKGFPLVNVIDPTVKHLTKLKIKKVGIIGTRATINANIYAQKINKHFKTCKVKSLATPLLANYIEEGFFKKKEITQLVLKEYLENPHLKDIEALILACTHYPLIKADINFYYDGEKILIDSTDVVANYLQAKLNNLNLLNSTSNNVNHRFVVSDLTPSFESTAKMFFGSNIVLSQQIL